MCEVLAFNKSKKEEKLEKSIFYTVTGVIFLIWASLWLMFYLKAEEVTKDPCSICSKRHGEQVVCTREARGGIPIHRYYYPNGTIIDDSASILNPKREIDLSLFKNKTLNDATLES